MSFITISNNENLLWVKITPTTTITTTQQIVIEIPTRSSKGDGLFADDLGSGVDDGGDIITDIIDGDFSGEFMDCRLFHGDYNNYKPARVICGGFNEDIDNTELLFFAFKVVNPSISPQISIPFFVYSMNLDTMYKSNFGTVENAVYIRNTNISGYSVSSSGSFTTPTYQLQTENTYLELISRHGWSTIVN